MKHVEHRGAYMQLSADFVGSMLDIEHALQNPVRAPTLADAAGPKKIKHASGPVKARATPKRMRR